MPEAGRQGFRGYIASRPVNGVAYPHRVQNLVIRDYCQRKGMHFLLSATEGAVANSYMMLNDVLDHLATVEGIVLFSQFMLPAAKARRLEIYERVLSSGAQMHAAMEEAAIVKRDDIQGFDEVLTIDRHLAAAPFAGKFPNASAVGLRAVFLTGND